MGNVVRGVLVAFRQWYESALCYECNNNNSIVDADKEKKDSSLQLPLVPITTPTYEICDDPLAPLGLRLLDDMTLYRYIIVNRRGDSTFDAEASYQRLMAGDIEIL